MPTLARPKIKPALLLVRQLELSAAVDYPMHLIQILLPLAGGKRFPAHKFEHLAQKLTKKFGGATTFTRSPAEGRWKSGRATEHDDIAVIEVMTETLEREWWTDLRERLEREFDQDEIIMRCQQIERL
jgi:hypothetical protein